MKTKRCATFSKNKKYTFSFFTAKIFFEMKQKIVLCVVTVLFFLTNIFAQPSKIKVACIGNSVTYGYGLKNPITESYPVQLQKMLGEKYEVKNFGHSGATLLRKGHNPYYKTK